MTKSKTGKLSFLFTMSAAVVFLVALSQTPSLSSSLPVIEAAPAPLPRSIHPIQDPEFCFLEHYLNEFDLSYENLLRDVNLPHEPEPDDLSDELEPDDLSDEKNPNDPDLLSSLLQLIIDLLQSHFGGLGGSLSKDPDAGSGDDFLGSLGADQVSGVNTALDRLADMTEKVTDPAQRSSIEVLMDRARHLANIATPVEPAKSA